MSELKVLHIGRKESFESHTPKNDFTESVQKTSLPMGLAAEEYIKAMPDANVLIVDAIADIPTDLINALPSLKMIHSEGVAYNRIDCEAAGKKGVYVCNCAGMNAMAVAEQALLLMLGCLRDVAGGDRAVREGKQQKVKEAYMIAGSLKELSDCTVGLIGLGAIGRSTTELLKAFHAKVYYTQHHRLEPETEEALGVTWLASQDDLLAVSDIVSLHLPVTPQTEKMCNAAFFEKMKAGSILINTSRGELVDDSALIHALKSGRLAMAGLDTIDCEPVKKDHILLNASEDVESKILFSPHIGGITGSSSLRGYATIWENVERISAGERPVNIVNQGFLC